MDLAAPLGYRRREFSEAEQVDVNHHNCYFINNFYLVHQVLLVRTAVHEEGGTNHVYQNTPHQLECGVALEEEGHYHQTKPSY